MIISSNVIALDRDEVEILMNEVGLLVENKQYENAAQLLAQRSDYDISQGYRVLSVYNQLHSNDKNRLQLAKKYASKGCDTGDYVSCIELAKYLVNEEEFDRAETILLDLSNNHSDPNIAGNLVSLYHNRDWHGFDKEKGKYWQFKASEYAKLQSNKSLNTDAPR